MSPRALLTEKTSSCSALVAEASSGPSAAAGDSNGVPAPDILPTQRASTAPFSLSLSHSLSLSRARALPLCVCARARVCVTCVRARAARACVCVRDHSTLLRLSAATPAPRVSRATSRAPPRERQRCTDPAPRCLQPMIHHASCWIY